MQYFSTRSKKVSLTSAEAIAQGLSRDGGLFVPETIPVLSRDMLEAMIDKSYQARAAAIMGMFLTDYSAEELESFVENAYSPENFDDPDVAPVRSLDDATHFLELWHGPTCAFKDMALQILPYYLTAALKKTGEERQVCILVATSGDTGKAALEGFKDVPQTRIMVFYPRDGVSDIQKLQMTSQQGNNVNVCSVIGNFDDAQNGVKAIFSDEQFRERLSENGWFLSSANSINWGRLLPQIVYYVSAYCDLVKDSKVKMGDSIDFCVPTGNFGDILAGYYARRMGLPVGKLICASNANNVLTDFIRTGTYDRNRPFHTTISPSMDILISSNLERLLYHITGSAEETAGYMKALAETGRYTVKPETAEAIREIFDCGFCSDDETRAAIAEVFERNGYLMDTHTAVAYHVLQQLRSTQGETRPCVVVSTASAFKFCASVLEAFNVDMTGSSDLELIDLLSAHTGAVAPKPLAALKTAIVRFKDFTEKEDMLSHVSAFLDK